MLLDEILEVIQCQNGGELPHFRYIGFLHESEGGPFLFYSFQ